MRLCALPAAIVALALASPLRAEPVGVRSGDHADFARLVLNFDASQGWQLGRVDGGWEFRAARADVEFDVSQVFELIQRNRIAGIESPGPGVLRILADCACHVDSFEMRRGRVVIDVKDGPAGPGNRFEARLDSEAPETAPPAVAKTVPAPKPPVELPEGLAEALRQARLGPAAEAGDGPDRAASADLPADFAEDLARAGRSRAFEQIVLEQLARAGSQGLILPADLALPQLSTGSHARPEDAPAPVPEAAALPAPANPDDHIRVETAIDRDGPGAIPAADGPSAGGHICPAPGRIDLTGLGYLRDGAPVIDEYRAALSGEFDRIDPGAAMRLARYYIFLTFGAEARQMLDFVPPSDPDWQLVAALAEILDHQGSAPVGLVLADYETCASEAAMWAVLAGDPLRPGQEVNENAVVQSFADLPPHAKTLLGPRLIRAFTEAGRLEAAAMLRNALQLGATERTIDAVVANAQLDAAMGDPDGAGERLDAALAETDADDPEALLALAEHRLDQGQALDPGLTEALEAIAYEQRGNEMAAPLALVLARAALARGDHGAARKLILTRLPAGDGAARGLLRRIYLDAAANAGDESFLRLVVPQPQGLGRERADRPARLALANRLLALGFPGDALAMLGPGVAAGEDHEARLLAARALRAQGDAALAAAALAALEGADIDWLMAEVQEDLGNYAEARRLYAGTGRPADADRMAVLERDWDGLVKATDPALRDLAARFAEPLEPADPGAEPYAAAKDLLDASARDRAALAALLRGP